MAYANGEKRTTACLQTFSTFELLEAILSLLKVQDLLLAQRVCKQWHAVIQTSSQLQEHLFFQPKAIPFGAFDGFRDFTINPLLKTKFPMFFEWGIMGRQQLLKMEWNQSPETETAYIYAKASWRSMLVINPPVRKLVIQKFTQSGNRHFKQLGEGAKSVDTLRMGWLYDYCSDYICSKFGTISLHWTMCIDDWHETRLDLNLHYYMPDLWAHDFRPVHRLRSDSFKIGEVMWQAIEETNVW